MNSYLKSNDLNSEVRIVQQSSRYLDYQNVRMSIENYQPLFQSLKMSSYCQFDIYKKLKNSVNNAKALLDSQKLVNPRAKILKQLQVSISDINEQVNQILNGEASKKIKQSRYIAQIDYENLNQSQKKKQDYDRTFKNFEDRIAKITKENQQLIHKINQLSNEIRIKNQIIQETNRKLDDQFQKSTYLHQIITTIRSNLKTHNQPNLQSTILKNIDFGTYNSNNSIFDLSKIINFKLNKAENSIRSRIADFVVDLKNAFDNKTEISNILMLSKKFISGIYQFQQQKQVSQIINDIDSYQRYIQTKRRLEAIASMYSSEIENLKNKYPQIQFQFNNKIFTILKEQSIDNISIIKDVVQIEKIKYKTTDERIKNITISLINEIRNLSVKYPQLRKQLENKQIYKMVQNGIFDILQTKDYENLISIIQYIPQVVHVQNINNLGTYRSQIYLKSLIKKLVVELQSIRKNYGIVISTIDQEFLIELVKQINGIQNVDQLILNYRGHTKIVEVEKIVEKVVEKVVEVHKLIPVQKIVEKIVQVQKFIEIEKVVNVPIYITKIVQNDVEKIVEVQKIVQKIVEVPIIIEKVIEVIREVPKIVQIQKIIQIPIVKEVEVIVQKVVNHVITEYNQIQIIKEKIVEVIQSVEKIVEVPIFIEKIVEIVKEVPKIIEVEKIVEKIVKVVEFKEFKLVDNHIQTKYEIIDRMIQKIIPIERIVEKVVQVQKVIEKIVKVVEKQEIVKPVQLIKQVIAEKQVPVYIDKVEKVIVTLIKQVQKVVQKRIDIPIIVQRIVSVPINVNHNIIQTIEKQKIKEVQVIVNKIIYQNKIIEVELHHHHIEKHPELVSITVEKLVSVPLIVEKIKQQRVIVEKIIEKLVQVPKVVEIEKIVQKIVVVPRIIDRIVQVPQIVEIIVPRVVQVQKIIQIEKLVQVPVIQEKIVYVQKIQNHIVLEDHLVENIVERIIPVETVIQNIKQIEKIVEIPVEIIKQSQKELIVEKIVPLIKQIEKVIEVEKQKVTVIQVIKPVEIVLQKLIQVQKYIEKIVRVPQIREIIKYVKEQIVKIIQIEKNIEKIKIEKQIIEVEKIIPQYIQKIKEVEINIQNNVPVESILQIIKQIRVYQQKIIELQKQYPKIYQVQKIVEKCVKIPQIVEIQKINPIILKQEFALETFKQKIVAIPLIQKQFEQIFVEKQKPVPVVTIEEKIKIVEIFVNKYYNDQKMIEVDKIINHIQKQLQIVDKFEDKLVTVVEKIQQIKVVPQIIQKIVESIVLMPQIVQVTKHINEIYSNMEIEEEFKTKYINLNKKLNMQADKIRHLISLIRQHPPLKMYTSIFEEFLRDLNKDENIVNQSQLQTLKKRNNDSSVYSIIKQGQYTPQILEIFKSFENQLQKSYVVIQKQNEIIQSIKIAYEIISEKYKNTKQQSHHQHNQYHQYHQETNSTSKHISQLNNNNNTNNTREQNLIYNLQKKIQKLQNQKKQISNQLNLNNTKVSKMNQEYKLQLNIYVEQIKRNNVQLNQKNLKNQSLNTENEKLKTEIKTLEVEINNLKNTNTGGRPKSQVSRIDFTKELNELRNKYENQIRDVRAESNKSLDQWRMKYKTLEITSQKEILSLKTNNQIRLEDQKLIKKNEQLQNQVNMLRLDLENSNRNNSLVQTQMSQLQSQIKKLESIKENLEKQIKNNKSIRTDDKENQELRFKIQSLQIYKANILDENKKLKAQLEIYKKNRYVQPGLISEREQNQQDREIIQPLNLQFDKSGNKNKFLSPKQNKISQLKLSQQSDFGSPVNLLKKQIPEKIEESVMSLRQLIGTGITQTQTSGIILALIQKIKQQVRQSKFFSYTPDNILLLNYQPTDLKKLKIKLGLSVNKNDPNQAKYCAPEILLGESDSEKSCVYNIGLIWDELIHGTPYYKSSDEIAARGNEYKIRQIKINPIFKNSLFEMLLKESKKRIGLTQVRGRLSLQKFIITEQNTASKLKSDRK